MPQATQTNRTLAAGATFTEANFITALQAALTAAGFGTPFDIQLGTATGTNRYMVFQMPGDTTKAKGYVYLRIRWTWNGATNPRTATLFSALFDNWDKTTRSGTGMGLEYQCGIVPASNAALDFYSFSHPEIKHVVLNQNGVTGTWGFLNFIKPANKVIINGITLFDEATYPYGFISNPLDINAMSGVANTISPTGDSNYIALDLVNLSSITALANRIQRESAPKVYSSDNSQGAVAQFSSDVGVCACRDAPWLAEVNDGSRHVLLAPRLRSGLTLSVNPTIVYQ
jgi:hypothetical protein